MRPRLILRTNACCAFLFAAMPARAETAIYNFGTGGELGGRNPVGTLLPGPQGVLFGTTNYGGKKGFGVVYRLAPPSHGETNWTETVLHTARSFLTPGLAGDGVSDAIYGTEAGLSASIAFEILPPAGKRTDWRTRTIFDFSALPGVNFIGQKLRGDGTGALFGVGQGGAVFKLSPPSHRGAGWTATVLYTFTVADRNGPLLNGPLTPDGSGGWFGTMCNGGAANAGMVFRLAPQGDGAAWAATMIHSFGQPEEDGVCPQTDLTLGPEGSLYGVADSGGKLGHGTVFRLSPPQTGANIWSETVLYAFEGERRTAGPVGVQGPLVLSKDGVLYGVASRGRESGTIFKLTPPDGGAGAWTHRIIHRFSNSGAGGVEPNGGLVQPRQGGPLYGVVFDAAVQDEGAVFRIAP